MINPESMVYMFVEMIKAWLPHAFYATAIFYMIKNMRKR